MILGLKITGMKKANKGCLHVKDPIGKCLYLPGSSAEFFYLRLDREEKSEL